MPYDVCFDETHCLTRRWPNRKTDRLTAAFPLNLCLPPLCPAALFRALVYQEMAFFDTPGNESGALCARLATAQGGAPALGGSPTVHLLSPRVPASGAPPPRRSPRAR